MLSQKAAEVSEQGPCSAREGIERPINEILNIMSTIFFQNGNRE